MDPGNSRGELKIQGSRFIGRFMIHEGINPLKAEIPINYS
jgi:hypothetical protein